MIDLDGTHHAACVEEQLRVTRLRIAEASPALSSPEREAGWLETCAALEAAAASLESATTPLTWLRSRLRLSPTELRVLWVLIAHELCPSARAALRDLATENEPDVTLDVLRRVVYGSRASATAWAELSPQGELRARCLIEPVDRGGHAPAHRTTFRVTPRVLALVHGDTGCDDELRAITLSIQAPGTSELVVDETAQALLRAAIAKGTGLVVACGPSGSGRRSLVLACARAAGRTVVQIDSRKLATDHALADRQLRIIARECALLDAVPVFLHLDALAATNGAAERLELFERHVEGLVLATSVSTVGRRWKRVPEQIELRPLTANERAVLWQRALPTASEGDAALLANIYPLAPALIREVAAAACSHARDEDLAPRHIEAGLRQILDDRLAGLATRVTVTQSWGDLVLPDDQTLAVVELLARIRQRGRVYEEWGFAGKLGKGLGVTALFSGPPGTGKTMCAALVARDLGTELYEVDLAQITSKWIGETEKNLARLFDAAEAGHAMLLFDEADALFGKRTDVRSSNDRHANEQTNYLLQRLERFSGVCILTTNHDHALDEAFRRRLSAHVRFPVPDADEREKLWRTLLPAAAPTEPDLDFAALARKYVMSGGYIRNAVLRAAFLAADADEAIGNYHLAQAAQLEYEAMGKLAFATT